MFFKGFSQLKKGRIEEADKIAEELKLVISEIGFPKHIRFYYLMKGLIAAYKNDNAQAIFDIGNSISFLSHEYHVFDNQVLYLYFLALSYYKNGDFGEALLQFDKIIKLTTGRLQWGDLYVKSFYWQGKIFQQTGENKRAVESYERFLNFWAKADSDITEKKEAQEQLSLLGKKMTE
jgi:tetratricopeptide (TPR) repeat protein